MGALKFAGQLRANPKARIDNNWKIPADISAVSGQDTLSYTAISSKTVTAFTYAGVVYPIIGCTVADVASVKSQIYAILRAFEVQPVIKVAYTGGAFKFTHVGGAAVTGVTIDGTSRATTRSTTLAVSCDSVINVLGSVTPLDVNGTTNAVSGTYAYTGTSATDIATATSLKGAIETAITALSAALTVKVVVDNVSKTFRVTFNGVASLVVKLAAKATTQKNFVEQFV